MYTGNTLRLNPYLDYNSVYPCVYREHLGDINNWESWDGLSLCIQGTRSRTINLRHIIRFIPVYTGNTVSDAICASLSSVYPCVYREHSSHSIHYGINLGLSLCIQGTLLNKISITDGGRFIPVYTGNTSLINLCTVLPSVYPCVYREHQISLNRPEFTSGLSLCIQGTYFCI